jgi:ethanolamine utilization protein EutN/carbon dioxide concentrating mechanism protein CcmL
MLLAKVVGTVVSTRKDPKVEGFKFLLLRQVNPETLAESGFVVANDAVGCGVGEYVLYASGSSARQTEMTKDRPCDAVIMAIVDQWEVGGRTVYEKHGSEHGWAETFPVRGER